MSGEATARRRGLGMGLSALLGSETAPDHSRSQNRQVSSVPIELLQPSASQPRRHFDQEELEALADSLRAHGVLQPLVVRPCASSANGYEIVAGERRWRAAQRAGLHEVPVVVRAIDDLQMLELALVENLQREDLSPLEEARAYQRLIEEFQHTQEQLAGVVGKSRSHVANMLRLLQLPDEVQQLLSGRSITAGHARALLASDQPGALARTVIEEGLSVRETEAAVHNERQARAPADGPPPPAPGDGEAVATKLRRSAAHEDPDLVAVQSALALHLGLQVRIKPRGRGGRLELHYSDGEQLEALIDRLKGTA